MIRSDHARFPPAIEICRKDRRDPNVVEKALGRALRFFAEPELRASFTLSASHAATLV